jgi:hypothetical protein
MKLLSTFFAQWITQQLPCDEYYDVYNHTTQGSNYYNTNDCDDYEDYEDEFTETIVTSYSTTNSTTPTTTTTTTAMKTIFHTSYVKPLINLHTFKPLMRPYGDWYPEKHLFMLYPSLNSTNVSVLCIAGFPNIPYFGKLEYWNIYRHDFSVTNVSFPPVSNWFKILALGTQHYRFPIILTDPLPQPWTSVSVPENKLKYASANPPFLQGQTYICIISIALHSNESKTLYAHPAHIVLILLVGGMRQL